MASLTHNSLGYIQYVTGGTTSPIYTNPPGTTTYVRGIFLFNANANGVETPKLFEVPAIGGTVALAGTQNQIFRQPLNPYQSYSIEFPGPGLVLPAENDTIQATTTSVQRVTVRLFGDYAQ